MRLFHSVVVPSGVFSRAKETVLSFLRPLDHRREIEADQPSLFSPTCRSVMWLRGRLTTKAVATAAKPWVQVVARQ